MVLHFAQKIPCNTSIEQSASLRQLILGQNRYMRIPSWRLSQKWGFSPLSLGDKESNLAQKCWICEIG